MTEPQTPSRTPRSAPQTTPAAPRRRPSEERAAIAASSRTATQLAVVAIVIAAVALGLTIWRVLAPAAASCQSTAWSAAPAADQLPAQWAVKGATFDISRRTTSFVGPDPGDGSGNVPTVLATVTCYAEGASDAVTRSEEVARSNGQVVNDRPDLGDQGFEATDPSGAIFVQFRHGDIVVDIAGGGGATVVDVDTIASGYDKSLGGDGGTIPSEGPSSSGGTGLASPGPSGAAGPSASPAAPELEKLLPAKVGSVDLTVDSALGSTVLQSDQGSRAITAALRAAGKSPDALRLAEAYDATQNSDLNMLAVTVDGMDVAKVRQLVLDSWLAASGAGVTQTQVTLGGKEYTKIDLGDEGPLDYVRTENGVVFVITTSDATLAEQAAALLP
jgi:hypothetical protein